MGRLLLKEGLRLSHSRMGAKGNPLVERFLGTVEGGGEGAVSLAKLKEGVTGHRLAHVGGGETSPGCTVRERGVVRVVAVAGLLDGYEGPHRALVGGGVIKG